jgi:hypothetical protein
MRKALIAAAFLCLAAAAVFLWGHHKPAAPVAIRKTVTSTSILNLPPLPEEPPNRTILDHIENYVDVPAGATDWRLFGQTTAADATLKDPDGRTYHYLQPRFSPALKALDGRIVTIKGFMFPLGEGEAQGEFLFGPFPVNCPFHYHVGPSLVMEVHADAHPVPFSYDAVTLRGRLQLVPDDRGNTLFYRLLEAQQVN